MGKRSKPTRGKKKAQKQETRVSVKSATTPAANKPAVVSAQKSASEFWRQFITLRDPPKTKLTPEEEDRLLRRALMPYSIERQSRELEQKSAEISRLEGKIRSNEMGVGKLNQTLELQRAEIKKLQEVDFRKSSILAILIRAAKVDRKKLGLNLSARQIAAQVDGKLKGQGLHLRQLSPKKWRMRPDLPGTLFGCLTSNDQKLRQATKTLISRA